MTARDEGAGTMGRGAVAWIVAWHHKPSDGVKDPGGRSEVIRNNYAAVEARVSNLKALGWVDSITVTPLYAAPVSAPGMDREAVARIVDPDGWATFDRQRATLTNMGRDPETELGPWMYVKRSLAKADQIIALQRDAEPADGSQVEPSTTGTGRQIIPTDDQGGEGT